MSKNRDKKSKKNYISRKRQISISDETESPEEEHEGRDLHSEGESREESCEGDYGIYFIGIRECTLP